MKTLGNFPTWQSGILEQIAQRQTCPNSVNELVELIDRFTTNCHYQATYIKTHIVLRNMNT